MSENMLYALNLSAVGLGIVFAVLAMIATIVTYLKRMDSSWHDKEYQEDAAMLEKTQNIDDVTLVLISAAVATVVRQKFRLKNIRVIRKDDRKGGAWQSQGRGQLHASHSIEKK